MLRLWHEAGLPKGVVNLVQGGREVGEALSTSQVDGVLFTGSARVGALLHKQLGGQPEKILALEMGGNTPLVVWETGDVNAAALLVLQSAYLTSGQRCTCARRLILPKGEAGDALIAALTKWIDKVTMGGYNDAPAPFIGPVISNTAADQLMATQDALIASGALPIKPMQRADAAKPFITPGVLDVTALPRKDEEYFGPLLQIIRVDSFDAAIDEANATRYGLAAGLISDNPALWDAFTQRIRAGVVNWNRPTNGASSAMPFGGVGISGNHRPSAFYAADYCAYPMASMQTPRALLPDVLPPGIQA